MAAAMLLYGACICICMATTGDSEGACVCLALAWPDCTLMHGCVVGCLMVLTHSFDQRPDSATALQKGPHGMLHGMRECANACVY